MPLNIELSPADAALGVRVAAACATGAASLGAAACSAEAASLGAAACNADAASLGAAACNAEAAGIPAACAASSAVIGRDLKARRIFQWLTFIKTPDRSARDGRRAG